MKAAAEKGRNNYGYYEIDDRTITDLVAVLEASKPTVVDRDAAERADGYLAPLQW